VSAPPSEQLNGSPSRTSTLGLGFLQPEPEPELPPSQTTTSPESLPGTSAELGPDSGSEWPPDELSESPADTRSTASRRGSNPLVGEGLRDMFRNGVIIASHQAHTYLGRRTEGQAEVQLYLADQEDSERIGDPLARIAARRDGVGEMSPDAADLMAAFMGLAGFASKQIQAGRDRVQDRRPQRHHAGRSRRVRTSSCEPLVRHRLRARAGADPGAAAVVTWTDEHSYERREGRTVHLAACPCWREPDVPTRDELALSALAEFTGRMAAHERAQLAARRPEQPSWRRWLGL
jgi:hypothetical protein